MRGRQSLTAPSLQVRWPALTPVVKEGGIESSDAERSLERFTVEGGKRTGGRGSGRPRQPENHAFQAK